MDTQHQWVEIAFDCLPLRGVSRLDAPIDASPKFHQFCLRVKAALEKHGAQNTYYLHRAHCRYHLTNRPDWGTVEFEFEGTVLTDSEDRRCERCDLDVKLVAETCDWLTRPVVEWFQQTVSRSVAAEFDRFIAAGDLTRTQERLRQIEQASDAAQGFLGMYL